MTILSLFISLAMSMGFNSACTNHPIADENGPVRVHSVDEFASKQGVVASHKGLERHSTLEPMHKYMRIIPASQLATKGQAIYPRIKKMANGQYIMTLQGARIGSRIYYYISDDLLHWSSQKMLWEPKLVDVYAGGTDWRRYTTADEVVLPNGDIVAVCSFRSKGYSYGKDSGLCVKISHDNAQTWSDEIEIYHEPTWEPCLLALPDGTIHCYFTDCWPENRNSGTTLLVSRDGGRTWGERKRVARLFKFRQDGIGVYTDQMPCFRLLTDGRTICGMVEDRLQPDGPGGADVYTLSLIYHDGFEWKDLGEDAEGPSDRQTNLCLGAAPYMSVFPSGEVLVSSNSHGSFRMKLGSADGRVFNGSWDEWMQPFDYGIGYWGCNEVVSAHEAICAMHCDDGISFGKFYLNHAVSAVRGTVEVDGNGSDWTSDEALFIGSENDSETIFRAMRDDKFLYILAERKDAVLSSASTVEMYLSDLKTKISFGLDGVTSSVKNIKGRVSKGQTADGTPGLVAEIAVPISTLKQKSSVGFYAIVRGEGLSDSFDGVTRTDSNSWIPIKLQ